jgi:hypothetical protein
MIPGVSINQGHLTCSFSAEQYMMICMPIRLGYLALLAVVGKRASPKVVAVMPP